MPTTVSLVPFGVDGDIGFEPQQGPLDKELDGARALYQTRGLHTSTHLYIEEVVSKEVVGVEPFLRRGIRGRRLRQKISGQSIALLLSKHILNVFLKGGPSTFAVFGQQQLL